MVLEEKETDDQKELDRASKLDKFKRDIINDADDLSDVRDKANTDMRFINVPGGMWEDFQEEQFSNRYKPEFDMVSDHKNKFDGEWNNNRMGVEFKPEDAKTTSDADADMLNGIFRADFMDENGLISLKNAVKEASTCGYGCIKLGTKFVDPEDPANDLQRVEFRPKINPYNSVFWDRNARWVSKRDSRHATELEAFTVDAFEEEYPGMDAISAYTPHDQSFQNFEMNTKQLIYVATRYDIVKKKEFVYVYSNLAANETEVYNEEDHELIKDELKANEFMTFLRKRKMIRQTVEKSIFTGQDFILEPQRIPGKWIPLIPFYAYHSFVDGVEYYFGLVRKLIDPQRLFNMQMAQLAENSASNGEKIPIFDPDQIDTQLAGLWANRSTKPYMLARSLRNEKTGEIIQHGPLGYLEPSVINQSQAALLEIVPKHIQQVTGGAPQDTADPNASGKAILAIQQRENLKTQPIMDNFEMSITWLGEVYQSIASEIYNSRRIMKILGEDGTQGKVELFREMMDENTGKVVIGNTLRGKKFRAYASTGPQYETKREQMVEDIKGMIEMLITAGASAQKYIPMLVALMLENMTGVGMQGMKKLVRQDLILMGLAKAETDEEKEFMAQIQQQQQQPDSQEDLIKAAAEAQRGEATKFISEARNLDSKSIDNIASAKKKGAETRKLLSEVGNERIKSLAELMKATIQKAEGLPVGE